MRLIPVKKTVIGVLAAWLFTGALRAGDPGAARLDNWHHWRGPEATGWAPRADPPITWDAQKNVKWKAPLSGKGSATPIVWGDQVFVVTAKFGPPPAPTPDNPHPRHSILPDSFVVLVLGR